jgi:hypothetical protein
MKLITTSLRGGYSKAIWRGKVKQEAVILAANRFADLAVMHTFKVKLPHWIVAKEFFSRDVTNTRHCLVVITGLLLLKEGEKLVEISMEMSLIDKVWHPLGSVMLYEHDSKQPDIMLQEHRIHREQVEQLALEYA